MASRSSKRKKTLSFSGISFKQKTWKIINLNANFLALGSFKEAAGFFRRTYREKKKLWERVEEILIVREEGL